MLNILAGIYHDIGELDLAGEHLSAALELYAEAREQAERALELAGDDDLFIEVDACLVLAEVNRSVSVYDDVLRRAIDAEFRIIEVRALAGKGALTQDKSLYDKAVEHAESVGLRYRADLVRALRSGTS